MKWHGAWFCGVHRTCRDGSSFMWHQPCRCCKYTTSVDIQKCAIKKNLFTHSECSESAQEQRIALHKNYQQQHMVEEDSLNLIPNGLCVSMAIRLKQLSASVSTYPVQQQRAVSTPNGWTASTSQWAPAVWTEVWNRQEVTRDGNYQAERLNTSNQPSPLCICLLLLVCCCCCCLWLLFAK